MLTALERPNTQSSDHEEWRAVVGYEGLYEVSSFGRVRSLDRIVEQNSRWGRKSFRRSGRVMCPYVNRRGYRSIVLCRCAHQKTFMVAALVAASFIGPRPEGYHVCHNDGVPNNNAASNLRYDTIVGNFADKVQHGTLKRGSESNLARATEEQVRVIRSMGKFSTWEVLAEHHGLGIKAVRGIINKTTWRHI